MMCWLINLKYADSGPVAMWDMPVWVLEYYLTHCL